MSSKCLVIVGDGKPSTLVLPLACDLGSLLLKFGILYGYMLLNWERIIGCG